jgi:hypothetical protein
VEGAVRGQADAGRDSHLQGALRFLARSEECIAGDGIHDSTVLVRNSGGFVPSKNLFEGLTTKLRAAGIWRRRALS